MKTSNSNLDLGQELMLLQGLTLIQNGLQFIEWADEFPNELSYDLYEILTDRFQSFQQCVLNGEQDYLIIDRAGKHLENIRHCRELNEKIEEQLKIIREQAVAARNEKRSRSNNPRVKEVFKK